MCAVHPFFFTWDLTVHLDFYLKWSPRMLMNHMLHPWVTSTISDQICNKWLWGFIALWWGRLRSEIQLCGQQLNIPKQKIVTGMSTDTFKSWTEATQEYCAHSSHWLSVCLTPRAILMRQCIELKHCSFIVRQGTLLSYEPAPLSTSNNGKTPTGCSRLCSWPVSLQIFFY